MVVFLFELSPHHTHARWCFDSDGDTIASHLRDDDFRFTNKDCFPNLPTQDQHDYLLVKELGLLALSFDHPCTVWIVHDVAPQFASL